MSLFAHHIGVEIMGREFSPETPMEHFAVFSIGGVLLALLVYGAYAALRDIRQWRHVTKEPVATP